MQQRMISIEEVATKLKPLFGKKIDELYFRYSTAESYEEKNELMQILMGLYQKNLSQLLDKGILLEPPLEKDVKGEYPLANVSYAGKELFEFGLLEKEWPRHMCVTGMSGSGKTTFAFNILQNFIKKDKPFLVFDWKKSFRPLMGVDNSIMAFTIGNERVSNLFKTNINRPPTGVSPKEWINTLCDLLTESFSASFGVHKILLETLDEIFDAWGVYRGSEHYPNWQHVKKMLENKMHESKGREMGWYESAMRIATVLTFGEFGKTVTYDGKKSLRIEDLFDKKVIFELNSLSNIEKKFFSEFVLTYIFKLKKSQEDRVDGDFNYAILVDEAHNIFLKKPTNFMAESVTDMIYREMREYGTSLICLDQHASKLSDTVTGNSACHVVFQQQLPEDIREISAITQLTDNKDMFSQLSVGQGIVKLSGRHTRPFLINVPYTSLREKSLNDEAVQSRMDSIIKGINIEKSDPEFVRQMINVEERPTEIKNTTHSNLNQTQEVLYNFAEEKAKEKRSLPEIEKLLEAGTTAGYYDKKDVMIVINELIKKEFNKTKENEVVFAEKKKILTKQDVEKYAKPSAKITELRPEQTITVKSGESELKQIKQEKKVRINGLNKDEEKFMNYLINNPEHENTTVALYKMVGLSARKGNVVKNKLLEKGLLAIEEVRSIKGWKKLIRPSLSYSQNH